MTRDACGTVLVVAAKIATWADSVCPAVRRRRLTSGSPVRVNSLSQAVELHQRYWREPLSSIARQPVHFAVNFYLRKLL